MNIYDEYPTSVSYNGKSYALNLAYDRVLMALDAQKDANLLPEDKITLAAELLVENPPDSLPDRAGIVCAIFEMLPHDEERSGPRLVDFHQDAAMIRSAFFRIGVDLLRQKIHIFQFLELLADLPKDTALMRTVEIRAKPIPVATKENGDYIRRLQEAKARVAIRMSDDEARDTFMAQLKKSTIGRG